MIDIVREILSICTQSSFLFTCHCGFLCKMKIVVDCIMFKLMIIASLSILFLFLIHLTCGLLDIVDITFILYQSFNDIFLRSKQLLSNSIFEDFKGTFFFALLFLNSFINDIFTLSNSSVLKLEVFKKFCLQICKILRLDVNVTYMRDII